MAACSGRIARGNWGCSYFRTRRASKVPVLLKFARPVPLSNRCLILSSGKTVASISRYRRLLTNALTDYRWTLYYLQRLSLHPVHREAVARAVAMFLPKSASRNRPDELTATTVERLQSDGFAPLDGLISAQQVNDINASLSTETCYDPWRPELSGFSDPDNANPLSVNAYYRPDQLKAFPQIIELANHPQILGSLEILFGAKPTISNIQVWWILHGCDLQANSHLIPVSQPHRYHRDVDDWMQFKLFVYLTDVDETAGPHAYIKGSHRWMLPSGQRHLQLQDSSYPAVKNLRIITGKAGYAFLENSFCLHRATAPKRRHRLILAVTYGLVRTPFWYSTTTVPLDTNSFDPYVNRIFMGH